MTSQTEAITAALNFIETHLCEPVRVGDIAQAAGYSVFHFIRTFNGVVRHTPYDYLMRRRLSHGALLLLNTDARVLDIALACQFESHEGFTRAFGRMLGLTPSAWREHGFADQRFLMPPLGMEDLAYREGRRLHQPEIIQLEPVKLAGWMKFMGEKSENEKAFRDRFMDELAADPDLRTKERVWEVNSLPQSPFQQEIRFLGIEAGAHLGVHNRVVIQSIPGGTYLRLPLEKHLEDRQSALCYLYHTIIPASSLGLAQPIEIMRLGEAPALYIPVEGGAVSWSDGATSAKQSID